MRVKNVSPAERVNADLLERFHFVKEAMLYERCSGYAMEVSFCTRAYLYRWVSSSEVMWGLSCIR